MRLGPLLAIVAASTALVAPHFLEQIADSDAGWHLALGRIITTSGIPFENALSWTSPHFASYPTSWLYDVLSLWTLSGLGGLGYQLAHLGIVASALLLLGIAAWHAGGRWGLGAVPVLAAQLEPAASFRPEIVSWMAFGAVLVAGVWGRTAGIRGRLIALPIIALAGNLHAGAVYAAGLLVCFCAEALWRTRRPVELVVAAVGVAALMANPGGAYNLKYLLYCLLVPPPIPLNEMLPAWGMPQVGRFNIVCTGVGLVLAWRYRREEPTSAVLTLAFGILAFRTIRLSPELYLSMAPLVAHGLGDPAWGERARPRIALVIGLLLMAITGTHYPQEVDEAAFGPRFDATKLPVRAARFLTDEHLTTDGFNTLEEGGYLEYANPDFRAFTDGRISAFPPRLFSEGLDAMTTAGAFPTFLEHEGATWAILNCKDYGQVLPDLLKSPTWALIYWDQIDAVFARRDVPALAPLVKSAERFWLRPYSPPSAVLKRATTREQEDQVLDEVARYLRYDPDAFGPMAFRCVLETRRHSPDLKARCDEAWARATSAGETQWLKSLLSEAVPAP